MLTFQKLISNGKLTDCTTGIRIRQEPDVPLLMPEVNPEHTGLVHTQRQNRGWKGYIVTNPNCTISGLTVALK